MHGLVNIHTFFLSLDSLFFGKMWSKVRSTLTKGRLFFVVKLFLIIVANRIFLSIIENKQQETIFANFLSHFVDYRSANLRIIIALGMSVCSVIIQYNGAKVILKLYFYFQFIKKNPRNLHLKWT